MSGSEFVYKVNTSSTQQAGCLTFFGAGDRIRWETVVLVYSIGNNNLPFYEKLGVKPFINSPAKRSLSKCLASLVGAVQTQKLP